MRTAEQVEREARKNKLSIFCASCTRYWDARDRGVPGAQCMSTAMPKCCSPLAGGEFHDYHGPITDFARWCFVCGAPSHQGVQAAGKHRLFGVCAAHLAFISRLKPAEGEAAFLVVRTPHALVPVEALVRPAKPSALVREMLATQEEWDHEARKRGSQ